MVQVKSHQCLMQWHKYFPPPTGNTLMHPSSTICLKSIWNGLHQLTRKLFQGPSLARDVPHHPCTKTPLSIFSLGYPEPGLSEKQLFAFVLFWGDRAYLLSYWAHLWTTMSSQSPFPSEGVFLVRRRGMTHLSVMFHTGYLLTWWGDTKFSKGHRENDLWFCCSLPARPWEEALGSMPAHVEEGYNSCLGSVAQDVYPQGNEFPLILLNFSQTSPLCSIRQQYRAWSEEGQTLGCGGRTQAWDGTATITTPHAGSLSTAIIVLCIKHQQLSRAFCLPSQKAEEPQCYFPWCASVGLSGWVIQRAFHQERMNVWGHGSWLKASR